MEIQRDGHLIMIQAYGAAGEQRSVVVASKWNSYFELWLTIWAHGVMNALAFLTLNIKHAI